MNHPYPNRRAMIPLMLLLAVSAAHLAYAADDAAQADPAAPPPGETYKITWKIYEVHEVPALAPDMNGTSKIMETAVLNQLDEENPISVGGYQVTARGRSLLWDGEKQPKDEAIRLIVAPSITLQLGQDAEMELANRIAVPYFEAADPEHPDLFAYRVAEYDFSTKVTASVNDVEAAPEMKLLRMSVTTSMFNDARTPLEGVGLDVGKPIINTQTIDGKLGLRPGNWAYLPQINQQGTGNLIFLHLERQEAGVQE